MAAAPANDEPEGAAGKDIPPGFHPLEGMLEMVAFKKGMVGEASISWVGTVLEKLEDVGVTGLRDFVRHVLVLNTRLANNGHRQLHQTTLNMMLREVCEMMFGEE